MDSHLCFYYMWWYWRKICYTWGSSSDKIYKRPATGTGVQIEGWGLPCHQTLSPPPVPLAFLNLQLHWGKFRCIKKLFDLRWTFLLLCFPRFYFSPFFYKAHLVAVNGTIGFAYNMKDPFGFIFNMLICTFWLQIGRLIGECYSDWR